MKPNRLTKFKKLLDEYAVEREEFKSFIEETSLEIGPGEMENLFLMHCVTTLRLEIEELKEKLNNS